MTVRSLLDAGRSEEATERLEEVLAAADDLDDPGARARLRIHAGRSLVLLGAPPVLLFWFQKLAAVDAVAFALSFMMLFFMTVAIEIQLVDRTLSGNGGTA